MAQINQILIGVATELYTAALPSRMFAMPARRVQMTIQSILTTGVSIDIDIEGSDDGTNFVPITGGNFSDAAGEIITLNISPKFIRANGSVSAASFSLLCVAKA